MSHNTPTEILARIKYKLIQDIGNLWQHDVIDNKRKNHTHNNKEFNINMDMLVDIISMEVVKK